jgi:hypothetical protein
MPQKSAAPFAKAALIASPHARRALRSPKPTIAEQLIGGPSFMCQQKKSARSCHPSACASRTGGSAQCAPGTARRGKSGCQPMSTPVLPAGARQ